MFSEEAYLFFTPKEKVQVKLFSATILVSPVLLLHSTTLLVDGSQNMCSITKGSVSLAQNFTSIQNVCHDKSSPVITCCIYIFQNIFHTPIYTHISLYSIFFSIPQAGVIQYCFYSYLNVRNTANFLLWESKWLQQYLKTALVLSISTRTIGSEDKVITKITFLSKLLLKQNQVTTILFCNILKIKDILHCHFF